MAQEVLEAYERCLRRYPTVQLSFEVFRARVEEILSREMRLPDDESRLKAFAQIHHEDLFLAIACSRDDRIAWEHFADDYLPVLRRFAAQACVNPNDSEDLAQDIAARMLKEKNRLAGYNGRGSLSGWLRVAVSHAAIDRFRRTHRQISLEDLQERGMQAADVESGKADEGEALDARWGPVVSRVANEAISSLSARDRLLLSLYYLRSVPLKTIGRQFGIHEATVSRWLDRLRQEIRKQVERELRKRHGLRAGEIQSLWKWISVSSVVGVVSVDSSPAAKTGSGCSSEPLQKKPARPMD
jgi:RNA polymerase sigma-70 factor